MKKIGTSLLVLLSLLLASGLPAYADVAFTPSILRGFRGLVFLLVLLAVIAAAVILLMIRKNRKKKDEEKTE